MPERQVFSHAVILPEQEAVAFANRLHAPFGGGPPNVELVFDPKGDSAVVLIASAVLSLVKGKEREAVRTSDDAEVAALLARAQQAKEQPPTQTTPTNRASVISF